jgi:hypothetical protein
MKLATNDEAQEGWMSSLQNEVLGQAAMKQVRAYPFDLVFTLLDEVVDKTVIEIFTTRISPAVPKVP